MPHEAKWEALRTIRELSAAITQMSILLSAHEEM